MGTAKSLMSDCYINEADDSMSETQLGGNKLYQLPDQSHSQMMSYIIATSTGKLIIIDGGTKEDSVFLREKIIELGNGYVEAWFLTHPHYDHCDALADILNNHTDKIIIKNIYYNFPSQDWADTYEPVYSENLLAITGALSNSCVSQSIIKKGDVLDFDSVKFIILNEPSMSITTNAINNFSAVIKMYTSHKSVLFLGDLGKEAGDKLLCEIDKEVLKADIVQMAHHGQSGVSREFYMAVNPQICLWPTPEWLWNNDSGKGPGSGPWTIINEKSWMAELGVKYHFIAKDGLYVIK